MRSSENKANDGARFLLISGHDYRSHRKAKVHFIARELSKRGVMRMFSVGFSPLSNMRGRDPRIGLEPLANAPAFHEGVECYLWRTFFHPFNPRHRFLQLLSPLAFVLYKCFTPRLLKDWAADSDIIFVESGIATIYSDRVKKWSPDAKVVYFASDDNTTINCDPYIDRSLHRSASSFTAAIIPSQALAHVIPSSIPSIVLPRGMDKPAVHELEASPYGPGVHAVSVGSMLFDPTFFDMAVANFPDITFHVIGSGVARGALPEKVVYHEEMRYEDTIKFIRHAAFGIAPYRNSSAAAYIADTSMKLIQYEYFGIPAVCPHFATGISHALRFGYTPGNRESIFDAIESALKAVRSVPPDILSWSEVADRILEPLQYGGAGMAD